MVIDSKFFESAIADAIRAGIKNKMENGYSSPLNDIVSKAITDNEATFRKLLTDAIASCLSDSEFSESIRSSIRQQLAKTLVQRFGGELEKQVNALKSDPTTRARIVLALEEIVSKNKPK